MLNSIPLIALGAFAAVYAGAVAQDDQQVQAQPAASIVSFDATSSLSVQDFVASLPQGVQDPLCATKNQIAATLSHDFAESVLTVVRGDNGQMYEVWTSDLMGTWTLLDVTQPDLVCIVQSGYGWSAGMTARDIVKPAPLSS
jgi:hypothetical protein